jgi:hypothetical protein
MGESRSSRHGSPCRCRIGILRPCRSLLAGSGRTRASLHDGCRANSLPVDGFGTDSAADYTGSIAGAVHVEPTSCARPNPAR